MHNHQTPMIQLFHVSKTFGPEIHALQNITLNLDKGEFAFLTGSSGAGKTTLLRILFGEELASSGQVLVDGRNISRLSQRSVPRLRRQIGVVFQDFKLIPDLTAAENVSLALEVVGQRPGFIRKKVASILNAVGLADKANTLPKRLSAGEQQRVAIARALVNDPKILLADEPTGNLDPELTLEISTLFNQINARGTTILFATHDMQLIKEMSKRVIHLSHGHLEEH